MEETHEKLEMQLSQFQKMRIRGQAGGVANDLNNLQVPIIGHSEMTFDDFSERGEPRESATRCPKPDHGPGTWCGNCRPSVEKRRLT